uniref:Uncharacterized protein n=1 Tax=Heterorhabditis bacteriophora TaxID=37862 RepID=A0A1I7XDN9_HETBA
MAIKGETVRGHCILINSLYTGLVQRPACKEQLDNPVNGLTLSMHLLPTRSHLLINESKH